ncbi:MAG: proline--tRNA ligase [Kiritimatiellae bacterium]|nr:proline--tRNA ligase [Kiritimatiellia bacterium]
MRWSQALLNTLRDAPQDAEIVSHKLMIRAGLLRKLGGGLYTYMPLGIRALRKVEAIVREEMERAGAQETLFPILQPAELWKQSGRWETMGPGMFRLKDRKEAMYVLAPTAEEAFTALAKNEISSYRQLPCIIYQMQDKFRDEIRPRFGLIRGKEFLMKDAYSFDADEAGADVSYKKMYDAYVRIFKRVGLDAKPVEADTGDIGGNFSHEFMVFASSGEDGILSCDTCGYAANQERAERIVQPLPYTTEAGAAEEVATPGQHACEEVAKFLGKPIDQIVKSLVVLANGKPVMVLVPGDRELNPLKLRRLLGGAKIEEADEATVLQAAGPCGSIGPVGLDLPVYADAALKGAADVVVGANKEGFHLQHVSLERDAKVLAYEDLVTVVEGDACPKCGKPLVIRRGTEVGQCFKLGTKYSEAFGASYLDETGAPRIMTMGCYGIGVSRTLQAIVEQSNDENGIIWPASVAPYQVTLLVLDTDNPEVVEKAEALAKALEAKGVDVFIDDRAERPGVKFKDADLIGFPVRVVAGTKGFAKGGFEVRRRTEKDSAIIAPEAAVDAILSLLA